VRQGRSHERAAAAVRQAPAAGAPRGSGGSPTGCSTVVAPTRAPGTRRITAERALRPAAHPPRGPRRPGRTREEPTIAHEITLPRLAATRETAATLVDGLPSDLGRKPVQLRGRLMSTSTASFADELVRLLGEHRASEVVLIGVTDAFRDDVTESGRRRSLAVRAGTQADLLA